MPQTSTTYRKPSSTSGVACRFSLTEVPPMRDRIGELEVLDVVLVDACRAARSAGAVIGAMIHQPVLRLRDWRAAPASRRRRAAGRCTIAALAQHADARSTIRHCCLDIAHVPRASIARSAQRCRVATRHRRRDPRHPEASGMVSVCLSRTSSERPVRIPDGPALQREHEQHRLVALLVQLRRMT